MHNLLLNMAINADESLYFVNTMLSAVQFVTINRCGVIAFPNPKTLKFNCHALLYRRRTAVRK